MERLGRDGTSRGFTRALSWGTGLALAAACTLWVVRGLDTQRLLRAAGALRVGPLLSALVLLAAGYVLRGVRWHYLFPDVVRRRGLRHSVGILLVGFLVNDFLPARAGELMRVMLMKRENGVRAAGVLATLFAERVFDGFVLGLLGLSALSGVTPAARMPLLALTAMFACLFVLCLLLALYSQRVAQGLGRWRARTRGRASRAASEFASVALSHLATLAEPGMLLRAFALTALIWSLEGAVFMLVGRAFATSLSATTVAAVLSGTNFASLAPTPGGLGTIEVIGTALLELGGVAAEPAFLVVTGQHLLHYAVAIVAGGYFAVRLSLSRSAVPPSLAQAEAVEACLLNSNKSQ